MRPSRQLISGEIAVSLFAIAYGLNGSVPWPFGPSWLFHLISSKEGVAGNVVWGLMLITPAFVLVVAGLREWLEGERWGMRRLDQSARARAGLVAIQCFSWVYVIHLLLLTGRAGSSLVLWHAAVGAIVCGWSYWENRRVRREIRHATNRFQADLG